MPLEIIRNDITKMNVDAIVNPTDPYFSGGGGVDEAIHFAAGLELFDECRSLGVCEAGQAKITSGCDLDAKYVIHTVGPVWDGGESGEEEILSSCYRNCFSLAVEVGIKRIAFPIISSGTFGYPKDLALETATREIADFLNNHEMDVFLVVYDKETFRISDRLFYSVKQYIDDNFMEIMPVDPMVLYDMEPVREPSEIRGYQRSLDDVLEQLEDTFSQTLLRMIDEKGFTDVEAYKRANIDKRLFSKIRSDVNYSPSKHNALAFAIALELNLDETKDLLSRAGFTISNSIESDLIVKYFIKQENYNIIKVNCVLFEYGQRQLGSNVRA